MSVRNHATGGAGEDRVRTSEAPRIGETAAGLHDAQRAPRQLLDHKNRRFRAPIQLDDWHDAEALDLTQGFELALGSACCRWVEGAGIGLEHDCKAIRVTDRREHVAMSR